MPQILFSDERKYSGSARPRSKWLVLFFFYVFLYGAAISALGPSLERCGSVVGVLVKSIYQFKVQ